MAQFLLDFPRQVEEACWIGATFPQPRSLSRARIEKIVFVGMGGSAIGGEVIRSLLASECPLPIWVSRHYRLPSFVDSKTLCIFSSYSGDTEETLSAFREGIKQKLPALAMTSGGELARLSRHFSIPFVEIPKGFTPRAALGYSVFPLLRLFAHFRIWKWDSQGVEETISLLRTLGKKYGPEVSFQANLAKKQAWRLWGRWVVVYAGAELLDSAALRFQSQIQENAKALAFHGLFPEMNHNEILAWHFPEKLIPKCVCVFLRDREDHPRVQLRMDWTETLLRKQGIQIEKILPAGKSRLARLFSVIHFADWISFYLALLYRIDPTPVTVIESLKKRLAKIPKGR